MRKETKKYYFSVEGETEKWYLDWLQNTINSVYDSKYKVKLDSKVEKDPCSYAKRITILGETNLTHIFDKESEELNHKKQFNNTLDSMKKAEKIKNGIRYKLGYSNFTFELWMILHKINCNGAKTDRSQYLKDINKAYGEKFRDLKEYKEENNFKRILEKLTISDVNKAVKRAKLIMDKNKENNKLEKYKGYSFYNENPSLSVGEVIGNILKETL